MHVLLGYFLCLVLLTPAISVDVFFALIGATSRQHDLLQMVRALSRMLLTVTSPFKIGLTLIVLLTVFAAESERKTRGIALLAATGFACLAMFHPLAPAQFSVVTGACILALGTAVTTLGYSWSRRLLSPALV